MRVTLEGLPNLKVDNWSSLTSFERNCRFWVEGQQRLVSALEGSPRYLRVRLEDVVSDVAVAENIFRFLGLDVPSADAITRVSKTRVNSQEERLWMAIVKMKQDCGVELLPEKAQLWSTQQLEVLEKVCGKLARAFGYSLPQGEGSTA
jgi:hypothetical protein